MRQPLPVSYNGRICCLTIGVTMPFVDARIALTLTDEQKEAIKADFGQAVSTFGKGEGFLMVGITDGYDLWLGGRKLDKGAYVSFSMIGDTPDAGCREFSAKVCDILQRHAGISSDSVYITFHPMAAARWGWNGSTFG